MGCRNHHVEVQCAHFSEIRYCDYLCVNERHRHHHYRRRRRRRPIAAGVLAVDEAMEVVEIVELISTCEPSLAGRRLWPGGVIGAGELVADMVEPLCCCCCCCRLLICWNCLRRRRWPARGVILAPLGDLVELVV